MMLAPSPIHCTNLATVSKRIDFFKLCQFISKLRVFIGYSIRKEVAEEHARRLIAFYDDHELKQLADGETLIMLSWSGFAAYEWIVWVVRGVGNPWQLITVNPNGLTVT